MNGILNNSLKSSGMNTQINYNFLGRNQKMSQGEFEKIQDQVVNELEENRWSSKEDEQTKNIDPRLEAILKGLEKDPIAEMAGFEGILEYNGVVLIVNNSKSTISIGDASNPEDVFSVGLSTGYTLNVNWDNISDLAKTIDLFKPEDVKRILHALRTSNHAKEKIDELEDLYNKICGNLEKHTSESGKGEEVNSRSQENNENKTDTNTHIETTQDGTRVLIIATRTAGGTGITLSLKLSETNGLDEARNPEQYIRQVNHYKIQTAIEAYEN